MIDKYILGLILTLIVGPAVTYYLTKRKAENDTAKKYAEAPLEAVQGANAQLVAFVREQMADARKERETDHKEREQLVTVLTETKEAMRALRDEIQDHREEERRRAAEMSAKLEEINREVIRSGARNLG